MTGAKSIQVFRRRNTVEKSVKSTEELCAEVADLLRNILSHIFIRPEKMKVHLVNGPNTVTFEVDLSQEDLGRLLGTKGKNIKAIRVVIAHIMATYGVRAIVAIKDEGRFF